MSSRIARYARTNFLALLALFIALGGTSFAAANAINGKSIKPHTIPKNRLTNSAIRSLKGARGARGAQGAQGAQGPTGGSGAKGTTGAKGPTGAAGTAVAYAHVNDNGTLDAANSKNVLSSRYQNDPTSPSFWLYCLQVAVPFKTVVATTYGFIPTSHIEVSKGDPLTSCNAGQVRGDATVEFNGGSAHAGFWIVFN